MQTLIRCWISGSCLGLSVPIFKVLTVVMVFSEKTDVPKPWFFHFSTVVTLKIISRSTQSNQFFVMSQLYIHENLERIQPLVHKILCRWIKIIPHLSCHGQITLSQIDKICLLPIPKQSSTNQCIHQVWWKSIVIYSSYCPEMKICMCFRQIILINKICPLAIQKQISTISSIVVRLQYLRSCHSWLTKGWPKTSIAVDASRRSFSVIGSGSPVIPEPPAESGGGGSASSSRPEVLKYTMIDAHLTHFRLNKPPHYILEESNFNFRYVRLWFRYSKRKMAELFANCGDLGQMLHPATSHLGLQCVQITFFFFFFFFDGGVRGVGGGVGVSPE